MLSLGADGQQPELEDGIHLRWQMDLARGFPPYGFDLFRRPHLAGTLAPFAAQAQPNGKVMLGATFRALELRVRLGAGGNAAVKFSGGRMYERPLPGGAGFETTLTFEADAMDEIAFPAGTVVLQAQGIRVSQDADLGWGAALNGAARIGVPLTDAAYPVTHAFAPDDWAETAARLSRQTTASGAVSLPASLAARFGGARFQDLQSVLRHLVAGAPSPIPATPGNQATPRIQVNALSLVNLFALDADMARILGLLRVDHSAPVGARFDYKIIGYWSPGSTTSQTSCTDVSTTTPGTVITVGTTLTLTPSKSTAVALTTAGLSAREASHSRDEPRALTIMRGPEGKVVEVPGGGRAIQFPALAEPLVFGLNATVGALSLVVNTEAAALEVTATAGNGEAVELTRHARPINATVFEITVTGSGFTTVVITGTGTGTGVVVNRVCVTTQVTTGDTEQWICFGVSRGAAPALAPLSAISATAVPAVDPDESPLATAAEISGIRDRHGLAAGLSWNLPDASTSMLPQGAVLYHVHRRSLGNQAQPNGTPNAPLAQFTRLTEEVDNGSVIPLPIRPSRVAAPRTVPAGWPNTPFRFIDSNTLDRWYAYAVTGVDVFGRTSAPNYATADLTDHLAPPPPDKPAVRFIDPELGPESPEYDDALAALLPANTDGALLAQWEWSPAQYRQGPDAREFRVYWQATRLNALTGTITQVTSAGDTSTVVITPDAGPLTKVLTDAWLRVGAEQFTILSSTTGANPTLTVRNLRLSRDSAGKPKPPNTGNCTVNIGAGDANYFNFVDPTRWATRLATVPLVQPLTGLTIAVSANAASGTLPAGAWTDNGDGTSTVALDFALRGAEGCFAGGTLNIGGASYPIIGNGDGLAPRCLVSNIGAGTPPAAPNPAPSGAYTIVKTGVREVATDIAATALPAGASLARMAGGTWVGVAGELRVLGAYSSGTPARLSFVLALPAAQVPQANSSCAWFPAYTALLTPNPALTVGAAAAAYGAVGISTSDSRDFVADRRGDAQRLGNEGAVTAPLIVLRARRTRPPATTAPGPALPPGQPHLYSTPPDYHGESFWSVTWTAVAGATYVLYRALDQALFRRDREQRRARIGYYNGRVAFDDDPGFAAWFATYAAAFPGLTAAQLTVDPATLSASDAERVNRAWEAWGIRFYAALTDLKLQALADRAGNETAFTRLNAKPITAASYDDTLDGSAPSRFLYRVRVIDVAGNESPLSPTGLPVYVPNVVAPARAVLIEAVGSPRTITLRWLENTAENLDHYRLYRSTDANDARDIRTMTLLTRIARDATVPLRPGEIAPTAVAGADRRWQIADVVPPKVTHYYRLVAVDSNDHRSEPSELVNGTALDVPPPAVPVSNVAWQPSPAGIAIRVQWAPQAGVSLRVQRRAQGSQRWLGANAWLDGGVGTSDLLGAEPYLSQELRLETRSETGELVTQGPIASLPSDSD